MLVSNLLNPKKYIQHELGQIPDVCCKDVYRTIQFSLACADEGHYSYT